MFITSKPYISTSKLFSHVFQLRWTHSPASALYGSFQHLGEDNFLMCNTSWRPTSQNDQHSRTVATEAFANYKPQMKPYLFETSHSALFVLDILWPLNIYIYTKTTDSENQGEIELFGGKTKTPMVWTQLINRMVNW